MLQFTDISIVIPAKNEARNLERLLPKLLSCAKEAEIIVVDDGSTDDTGVVTDRFGVKRVKHPVSLGNGAAIKSGARAATRGILVFMDGDGQHDSNDIPRLLARLDDGYDMVVGARQREGQASFGRAAANSFYNFLASYMSGQKVEDLTSGFRAVRADKFRQFLYLLPNGFSYPTTSTMAFFRAGYSVAYEPITVSNRGGASHIRPLKDGIRFLLIIFKIGTLYSPLKLFVPISFLHFALGILYYFYTFSTDHRLSIVTIFLLIASVSVFLIGLVSEQITALLYKEDGLK